MLGDVFYRVGEALGALEAQMGGGGDGRPASEGEEVAGEGALPRDAQLATGAALSALAAWAVARLLRPRPISWPRVVLAGAGAALLADLVGRVQDDAPAAGRIPYADDPRELLGRVSAGIGIAAGYAAILYPRLPGSPLFRGLAFGALEIAAAPRGGLVRLAAEAPGLRFPLQALALPIDEDASPLSHLAFGLGLGLLYRYSPAGDGDALEDEELEDD